MQDSNLRFRQNLRGSGALHPNAMPAGFDLFSAA